MKPFSLQRTGTEIELFSSGMQRTGTAIELLEESSLRDSKVHKTLLTKYTQQEVNKWCNHWCPERWRGRPTGGFSPPNPAHGNQT